MAGRFVAMTDHVPVLKYLAEQDNPSFSAQTPYQSNANLSHGYIIDFALETVFLPTFTFAINALGDQTARVSSTVSNTLKMVGGRSAASSAQRSTPLQHLFVELGFSAQQLSTFVAAIQAAPVMFPFDINTMIGSSTIMSVAASQKASGGIFPIPPSCLPTLSPAQISYINSYETPIFGLSKAIQLSNYNASCTERPIYGILNIFNLRLFWTSSGLPGQAVAITNMVR